MEIRAVPRQSRSLRQHVTETLRRAIVHGEIQPGERIIEEDLAERMEISRGPIREALSQLEQEGLISSFPYRGAVVADVASDEVLQVLIPIRARLEEFAIDSALENLTPEDVDRLERVVDDMRVAADRGDLAQVVELDMDFHRHVMSISGKVHCLQLWDLIAPRIRGLFYRMGPEHESLQAITSQHMDLLEALRSGDTAHARDTLHEHINDPGLYARLSRSPEAEAPDAPDEPDKPDAAA
jgi:DNA-binding GntR family transcriptional regulator